jgi:hypothetical protein
VILIKDLILVPQDFGTNGKKEHNKPCPSILPSSQGYAETRRDERSNRFDSLFGREFVEDFRYPRFRKMFKKIIIIFPRSSRRIEGKGIQNN